MRKSSGPGLARNRETAALFRWCKRLRRSACETRRVAGVRTTPELSGYTENTEYWKVKPAVVWGGGGGGASFHCHREPTSQNFIFGLLVLFRVPVHFYINPED